MATVVDKSLEPPEKRFLEHVRRWEPELKPQPLFGEALSAWVQQQGKTLTALAKELDCGAGTLSKWCLGSVPDQKGRESLRRLGFLGEFCPTPWRQDQFVRAELVQTKNPIWREGDFEGRQFVDKYAVLCRVQKTVATGLGKARVRSTEEHLVEYVFPDRVSDVIGVLSKGDAITDWTACQVLHHALGELVLKGVVNEGGELQQFELRGESWRKIKAWQKKALSSTLEIDHAKSHLIAGQAYTSAQLLEFHEKAFADRFQSRDRAGELGSRAHKLGHAWLKFHHLQPIDENGRRRVNYIVFPSWFWNWHTGDRSSTLLQIDLEYEPLEVQMALGALESLFAVNELEIVACEELLADVALGIAGACDCLVRDKWGRLVLLDWKTSKGVWSSYLLQLAWYARLVWLCRGEMPARAYIGRLDKCTAECEIVPAFTTPEERQVLLDAAMGALHLYRWNERAQAYLDKLKEQAKRGGS